MLVRGTVMPETRVLRFRNPRDRRGLAETPHHLEHAKKRGLIDQPRVALAPDIAQRVIANGFEVSTGSMGRVGNNDVGNYVEPRRIDRLTPVQAKVISAGRI